MASTKGLNVIASEINTLYEIAITKQKEAVDATIDCGKALSEAKKLCGKWGWKQWCTDNLKFSYVQADKYIAFFEYPKSKTLNEAIQTKQLENKKKKAGVKKPEFFYTTKPKPKVNSKPKIESKPKKTAKDYIEEMVINQAHKRKSIEGIMCAADPIVKKRVMKLLKQLLHPDKPTGNLELFNQLKDIEEQL